MKNAPSSPSRRSFLRASALATAACGCGSALAGCGDDASVPSVFDADIELTREDYPEIFEDGGLTTIDEAISGYSHPIFVRNQGQGVVLALGGWCSHRGCSVNPVPNGFQCPCHGSFFDRDGGLLEGPATRSLIMFDTELHDDKIVVLAPESDTLPETDEPT